MADDIYLQEYHSWSEFVDACEGDVAKDSWFKTGPGKYPKQRRSRDREDDYGYNWFGTPTFKAAIDLANYGWKDGLDRMDMAVVKLRQSLPARKTVREQVIKIHGPGTINWHRYATGHPKLINTWQQAEVETIDPTGKIITINFNATVSGGVSTDAIFRKGAACIALIDLLEQAGHRVEVRITAATKPYDVGIVTTVVVKRSQDAINMERLAFAMANPAMLRRLAFSAWERAPLKYLEACNIYGGGGYGRCYDHLLPNATNFPTSDLYRFDSREIESAKWLREQLSILGIDYLD